MADSALNYLRQRIRENDSLPEGARCRELREACGLTVADMATAMDVTGAAIRQWERGERTPRGALRAQWIEVMRGLEREISARSE
jgi:transcriptional regulator with XRE-family HTH domain